MDLELAGKVAIVTGGSGGLGRGCAEQLLSEGMNVLVTSRSEKAHRAAEELAAQHPGRVLGIAADLGDADASRRTIDTALEAWGRLDVLVCSGGGPSSSGYLGTSDEAWREAFDSVFLGPVRMARQAAEVMESGGCVGFVLSSSVYSPIPNLVLSNGLRPGLAMAAKTLSDELAPRQIRVVGLVPGRIATSRTVAVDEASREVSERRNRLIPLGRLGTVEEFAKVTTFVVSPAASYMTGTCVVVDGGALRTI